jgi:hypothetical protein
MATQISALDEGSTKGHSYKTLVILTLSYENLLQKKV